LAARPLFLFLLEIRICTDFTGFKSWLWTKMSATLRNRFDEEVNLLFQIDSAGLNLNELEFN